MKFYNYQEHRMYEEVFFIFCMKNLLLYLVISIEVGSDSREACDVSIDLVEGLFILRCLNITS